MIKKPIKQDIVPWELNCNLPLILNKSFLSENATNLDDLLFTGKVFLEEKILLEKTLTVLVLII